jgi:hypothetical protein
VKAAGINPSEAVIRTGAVAELFPSAFPSGQGSDLADHHDPVTTNHLPGGKPESAAKTRTARLRRST